MFIRNKESPEMDRISKLPRSVIETILCLIPIQAAARTSILCRDWRYHWTNIPKLKFNEYFFEASSRCKFFDAICQVLLMHQGPLDEFVLRVRDDVSAIEIDPIFLQLSKKDTIKSLTLNLVGVPYKLPVSFFSLHQLTDLWLCNCALETNPSFSGFRSLTYLHLKKVQTSGKMLLHLLSGCPLLKILTLDIYSLTNSYLGEFTIVDLLECLPVVEDLSVHVNILKAFAGGKLPKELPMTMIHLKNLCVERISLHCGYELGLLNLLIGSSPNLENLGVMQFYRPNKFASSFRYEGYSHIMLEHLKELDLTCFSKMKYELNFVKFILSKSPVLKKVRLYPNLEYMVDDDEDDDEEEEVEEDLDDDDDDNDIEDDDDEEGVGGEEGEEVDEDGDGDVEEDEDDDEDVEEDEDDDEDEDEDVEEHDDEDEDVEEDRDDDEDDYDDADEQVDADEDELYEDEESKILEVLLSSPPASPMVDITIEQLGECKMGYPLS